jgi:30S ribosomal protein S31
MGKGDKKSKRGKIIIGSYGVRRAHKNKGIKHIVLAKAEPKPKETLEQNPVVPVAETTIVVEQVEEKTPKKTGAKKTTPKKTAEKVETGESKPSKSKKKIAKPAEDLFSEKKEGTE